MHSFRITLAPRPGVVSGCLTTEIRAESSASARMLAQAQYPNYIVTSVTRRD